MVCPSIQFRLPCIPRTTSYGCQVVHWDPLNAKRSCSPKLDAGDYFPGLSNLIVRRYGVLKIIVYLNYDFLRPIVGLRNSTPVYMLHAELR